MTGKQEEIREEAEVLFRACLMEKGMDASISDSLSKALMILLNGLGVVIKIDRELPPIPDKVTDGFHRARWLQAQQDMLGAGYVAVEPLIKEDE